MLKSWNLLGGSRKDDPQHSTEVGIEDELQNFWNERRQTRRLNQEKVRHVLTPPNVRRATHLQRRNDEHHKLRIHDPEDPEEPLGKTNVALLMNIVRTSWCIEKLCILVNLSETVHTGTLCPFPKLPKMNFFIFCDLHHFDHHHLYLAFAPQINSTWLNFSLARCSTCTDHEATSLEMHFLLFAHILLAVPRQLNRFPCHWVE